MYRYQGKTSDIVETREPWRNCQWTVQLHINSRQSIHHMSAQCHKTLGPDIGVVGFAQADVAPFDDLGKLMRSLLTDSAIDALDAICGVQGDLFDQDQTPA